MNKTARVVGWGMIGHLAVPVSTAVLVLGLPFVLDPRTYGYWQLYLFYAMWLGYLTFGVPDGHHLRYAGTHLSALHPGRFVGTFVHLLLGVAVAAGVLALVGAALIEDPTQQLMWVLACAATVLFVPRTLLTAALQSASRFTPFAAVVLTERGLVVGLSLAVVALVGADAGALATADVLAKATGLVAGAIVILRLLGATRTGAAEAQGTDAAPSAQGTDAAPSAQGTDAAPELLDTNAAPELLDTNPAPERQETNPAPHQGSAWAETRADISIGSFLLLANLAAVAVHGVLRLAVERRWGVVEFGQVSLAFSAALLLTTAAHAMGWLSLPRLAHTPRERWAAVHALVRDGTRGPLAALVLLYLPAQVVLTRWLPDYRTALDYVGLLLPLVVVETRWRVVTSGLLKVMHRQRVLLALNLLALAAAVVLALWFTLVMPSELGVVLSLLWVTVLRSAVADAWLGRQLGHAWAGGLALDLLVVGALVAAMVVGGWAGAVLGLAVVAVATWWDRGATAEMLVRVRQEVMG
ncbi:hypothetical protein MWU75_11545 [Ornithinimicrobium sp. F0845]|uniref:hypothetical protein n=1 Tax=Ornithinimicrobium sp. F0845 TaxID=2926412 RepID=UPI001FF6DA63|nr:hypothetical protein [Ornithinimicrobium sp. F0845]MCK0112774.1 hypothetical protein [Ornithinimicrobium sp. F0845]